MYSVIKMSRVIREFERVCRRFPERTAIVHLKDNEPVSVSFAELREDVRCARAFLAKKGVKHGDRLLAFANSGYHLCVFLIACFSLGAAVMYADIHAGQENLRRIFEKTEPRFVLVSDKTRRLRVLFREIFRIKTVINIDRADKEYDARTDFAAPREEDDALMTVTTGSTGTPKLFVRTHADLWEQLRLVTDNISADPDGETVLTTSYIYIFANILQGFTTVLPNVDLGSKKTKKIIRRLSRFDLSAVSMIITTPDFCLRTPNMYPKLKTLYCGGAILNRSEVRKIRLEYPCRIIHIYGSTECSLMASVALDEYEQVLERGQKCLLGTLCKGVTARISAEGHILVKSKALLTKTADGAVGTDEDYDTHDVGFMEDGRLYYRGKAGFCLSLNGKTLYANEIEQRLILRFPEIGKCAAVEADGQYYLFLEDKAADSLAVAAYLKQAYGVAFTVKRLRAIPRDVKHHTKINYLQLQKRIKNYDRP